VDALSTRPATANIQFKFCPRYT